MHITLLIHQHDNPDDPGREVSGEYEPSEASISFEGETCRHCHTPLTVRGSGRVERGHEHFAYAVALCSSCKGHIGTLKWIDSLFGHKEDRTTLEDGRWRVYGHSDQAIDQDRRHGDRAAEQFASEIKIYGSNK